MSTRDLYAVEVASRYLIRWTRNLTSDQMAQIEALPLRCDMLSLLTYLRDNRVTGTQSTGNLPLKAVREVTAHFVHPSELDVAIGERIFRLRSEDDVWPLRFLHTLACDAAFLDGGPARRWRLTPAGEVFLAAPPALQAWTLFDTWWENADWLNAYSFGGLGESLPPRFRELTLVHLLCLSPNTRVPFEPFADELIQRTRLKWTAPDMTYARMLLHGAIERMVIRALADFGMAQPEFADKPLGASSIRALVAFQITSLGRGLLELLKAWYTC